MVLCRVHLLDGKEYQCDLDKKAIGQEILDQVFEHLVLNEKDYFTLTYKGPKNVKCWLNPSKKIEKQIKEGPWRFTFEVKFYVRHPVTLHDELTRYLLFLQVRTDILTGKLPCSFIVQALLCSYAVQSQVGDYDDEKHGSGTDYIKDIPFVPLPSDELLEKIVELHRLHKGETNAESELNYLENAKLVSLYGVHLHPAQDSAKTDVNIGVCAIGLLIFKDKLRINRYPWAKMIKILFKRDKFTIKIRPEEIVELKKNGKDKKTGHGKETTVVFKLEDVKHAKRLWRLAVEHHTFFRMREAAEAKRSMFSRNNKYHYEGRTEYQTRLDAEQIPRSGNDFTRLGGSSYVIVTKSGPAGYSTERGEQCIADDSQAATLHIRRPLGRDPLPNYNSTDDRSVHASDNDYYDRDQINGGVDILLGLGGQRYNDYETIQRRPDGTFDGGTPDINGSYQDGTFDQIGNENGQYPALPNRPNQNGWGSLDPLHESNKSDIVTGVIDPNDARYSHRGSASSLESSSEGESQYEGREDQRHPARDQWGNIIVTKNIYINRRLRSEDGSRLGGGSRTGSQDDYLNEHGGGGRFNGEEDWQSHTTTKTYTAEDGTIITEYRTEKDGVITTRIERRTRVLDEELEEEEDYDQALQDAIMQVTDMNLDMTVEKIEIHTKTEERYVDTPNYSLV